MQEDRATPRLVFSFRSFFADQAINIIASLGAFLILAGALSFIYTTPNLWLSFLVLLIVHAIFGVIGYTTYRLPTFRVVASIYTIIFALLVPLVGFSAYRLVADNAITLSVPVLIAVAAVYASVVYGMLALFQRFTPFAYLGMITLLVADLAVARAFDLGYWWWPSVSMLLAFAALVSARPSAGSSWPFVGTWTILRRPVRLLMYGILAATAAGVLVIAFYSFRLDSLGTPVREARFSVFTLTLLLLLWGSLFLWRVKRTRGTRELAYLFLLSVLAICYSFDLQPIGYALALTGVALFYHALERFAGRLLTPLSRFSPDLDQLALVLVLLVPFISSPLLPAQLFASIYGTLPGGASPPPFVASWQTVAELLALGLGLLLTISVALWRTGVRRAPANASWCWLLLAGGFLLTWGYGLLGLALHVASAWSFLGLALALVALAVFTRQRLASAWANPLDILALLEIILTLSLSKGRDTASTLLLFFAALSYTVLFYQRRQSWYFLPLVFALAALPLLLDRPFTMLFIGLLLPLASAAIHRLPFHRLNAPPAALQRLGGSELPLLVAGMLYGVVFSIHEVLVSKSAIEGWSHLAFPASLEIALLSLTWYASAAFARMKWLSVPAVGFALGALLLPANSFWVLAALTPIMAILGVGISRLAGRDWALPLYIVALCAAVMTGYSGLTQDHWAATAWIWLGFAALAYIIGVVDGLLPAMWTAPIFATGSLIASASLLGDLYRPPTIALICVVLGVSLRFLRRLPAPLVNRVRSHIARSQTLSSDLLYALPFYATALAAALLTGIYGTLSNINSPFYSAIPDALLVYALLAFVVSVFERRPVGLWLVAGFAIWGIALATKLTAYYVFGVGLGLGIAGLLVSRHIKYEVVVPDAVRPLVKFIWSWPWYAAALVAAVVTGLRTSLPIAPPFAEFSAYALLPFAVLAYLIGVADDIPVWSWIGSAFATWSLIYPATQGRFSHLVTAALVCTALAVGTDILNRVAPALFGHQGRDKRLLYAVPLYLSGLVAAILTGIEGMIFWDKQLFYSAVPDVLLLYALLAFVVTVFERRPLGLWLVAGFAIWSTSLAVQLTAYYITAVGIGAGIVGLAAGWLIPQPPAHGGRAPYMQALIKFAWNWPWYLTALFTAILIGVWPALPALQPGTGFIGYSLLALTVLALLVMLVERVPEALVFPFGLAIWVIQRWQPSLPLTSLMIAYSLLCVLTFATQLLWRRVPPTTRWIPAPTLHTVLSLGGLSLVVLAIITQNGLSADSGLLAQEGVGVLLVLALFVFVSGRLHLDDVARLSASESDEAKRAALLRRARTVQQWCTYGAGLLLSLVVSWELSALGQTMFDVLTLAPASYLTVIAPFLTRDEAIAKRRWIGQLVAIAGAALLLLPTLWLSFSNANLLSTVILLGESLALLLLGIITRLRIFVLGSASLIIVGGLHALFLPSLGIPPSLALALLGIILLAIATGFTLARRRLQSAWTHWE